MSTATVQSPPKQVPPPGEAPKLSVAEELITAAIAHAQSALWRAELSQRLLKLVIAVFAALLLWAIVDQWVWSPGPAVRLLALAGGVSAVLWWIAARIVPLMRGRIRAEYAAQSLEHDLPELRHALTSYVSLRGDIDTSGPRGAVVRSVGVRAAGQMKQHQIEVPSEATGTFTWWMVMAATLAIGAAYSLLSPKNTLQSAQRLLLPLSAIDAPTRVEISDIQPGDCEILAERPLEISAAIKGLSRKDEPSVQYGLGFSQRERMEFDPSTGRFAANVRVSQSTRYRIAAGDAVAGPFHIIARDVPVASVRSVQITPPKYTGFPPRLSTGGAVTAEENSQITVTASINRPVERARLEFNPRKSGLRTGASAGSIEMTVAPDGLSATATIPLRLPREKHAAVAIDSYRVRVWDTDGNENPDPIQYPVRVIADLPPEVTVVAPREVVKEVPINSQQLLEIAALDPDYGLRRIELSLRRGADLPVTEVLWSSAAGVRGNQIVEYRFRPQQLGLRVGDQVLVTAVAFDNREDLGEKPEPNRSETQPLELLIVPPQQLPPVSAPEDGLSEPDDEPANPGAPQDGAEDGGGDAQQDGQAGGAGGAGNADNEQSADNAQQTGQAGGASESPPSGDEDTASPDASGQGAAGQGASGAQESDGGEAMQRGQDDSGAPPQETGSQDAADSPSGDSGQPADSTRSPGVSEPADKSPPAGESLPDQPEPADSTAGDGAPESAPDSAASNAADPSSAGQRSAADPDAGADSPGEPQGSDAAPETAGPDSVSSDATPAQQDAGAGERGGTASDGGAAEPEQTAPPPHDGDAFERIRDYLNQQQPERSRQRPPAPDAQQPDNPAPADGQPSKASERAEDGAAAAEPAGSESGGQEPAGSEPAGSDAPGSEAGQRPDAGAPDAAAGADSVPGGDRPGESAGADAAAGADADPSGDADTKNAAQEAPGDRGAAADRPASDRPGEPGDTKAGEATPSDSPSGQPQPSDPQDSLSPPSPRGDTPGGSPGETPGDTTGRTGDGGTTSDPADSAQGTAADARPPDPVNLEHARQATDLVLDYLDQNRETPDPELLERLNWTPEELRDFTDRWRQLLKAQDDAPGAAGGDPQQIEEALRSLGIRQHTDGPIGEARGRDDALRGLRDAGNRPAAPTLYRDAFEAFRRGVNRPIPQLRSDDRR